MLFIRYKNINNYIDHYYLDPSCNKINTVYSRKFLPNKKFAKPSYLCVTEIFNVISSLNNNSPMKADGEIGEVFLLVKVSSYTIL